MSAPSSLSTNNNLEASGTSQMDLGPLDSNNSRGNNAHLNQQQQQYDEQNQSNNNNTSNNNQNDPNFKNYQNRLMTSIPKVDADETLNSNKYKKEGAKTSVDITKSTIISSQKQRSNNPRMKKRMMIVHADQMCTFNSRKNVDSDEDNNNNNNNNKDEDTQSVSTTGINTHFLKKAEAMFKLFFHPLTNANKEQLEQFNKMINSHAKRFCKKNEDWSNNKEDYQSLLARIVNYCENAPLDPNVSIVKFWNINVNVANKFVGLVRELNIVEGLNDEALAICKQRAINFESILSEPGKKNNGVRFCNIEMNPLIFPQLLKYNVKMLNSDDTGKIISFFTTDVGIKCLLGTEFDNDGLLLGNRYSLLFHDVDHYCLFGWSHNQYHLALDLTEFILPQYKNTCLPAVIMFTTMSSMRATKITNNKILTFMEFISHLHEIIVETYEEKPHWFPLGIAPPESWSEQQQQEYKERFCPWFLISTGDEQLDRKIRLAEDYDLTRKHMHYDNNNNNNSSNTTPSPSMPNNNNENNNNNNNNEEEEFDEGFPDDTDFGWEANRERNEELRNNVTYNYTRSLSRPQHVNEDSSPREENLEIDNDEVTKEEQQHPNRNNSNSGTEQQASQQQQSLAENRQSWEDMADGFEDDGGANMTAHQPQQQQPKPSFSQHQQQSPVPKQSALGEDDDQDWSPGLGLGLGFPSKNWERKIFL